MEAQLCRGRRQSARRRISISIYINIPIPIYKYHIYHTGSGKGRACSVGSRSKPSVADAGGSIYICIYVYTYLYLPIYIYIHIHIYVVYISDIYRISPGKGCTCSVGSRSNPSVDVAGGRAPAGGSGSEPLVGGGRGAGILHFASTYVLGGSG